MIEKYKFQKETKYQCQSCEVITNDHWKKDDRKGVKGTDFVWWWREGGKNKASVWGSDKHEKSFLLSNFFFLCRGRQYKNYVENSGVRELWEKRLIEAAEKWNPTLKRKNEV